MTFLEIQLALQKVGSNRRHNQSSEEKKFTQGYFAIDTLLDIVKALLPIQRHGFHAIAKKYS